MNESEFDKFADEYASQHASNISISGESPDYFARYKCLDLLRVSRPITGAPETLRVLDFGRGIGASTGPLQELFPLAHVIGVDVSMRSLRIAHQRHPQSDSVLFDGERLPLADRCIDLVLAACVFHHIDETHHVSLLQEIRRTLTHHGRLMVYEHNPLNPLTVRAVNTCPFDEHAKLIRMGTMKSRLRQAGFRHVSGQYRVFFPAKLAWLRRFESRLPWLALGAQYFVLGSP